MAYRRNGTWLPVRRKTESRRVKIWTFLSKTVLDIWGHCSLILFFQSVYYRIDFWRSDVTIPFFSEPFRIRFYVDE